MYNFIMTLSITLTESENERSGLRHDMNLVTELVQEGG